MKNKISILILIFLVFVMGCVKQQSIVSEPQIIDIHLQTDNLGIIRDCQQDNQGWQCTNTIVNVNSDKSSINLTIKEQPTSLIFYKWDYSLDADIKIRCLDGDKNYIIKNLSFIMFGERYQTKLKPFTNTIIKFPIDIRYYGTYDNINNLTKNEIYNCHLDRYINFRRLEYLNGVLTENRTSFCFLNLYDDFYIDCSYNLCEIKGSGDTYTFVKDDFAKTLYVLGNCFEGE